MHDAMAQPAVPFHPASPSCSLHDGIDQPAPASSDASKENSSTQRVSGDANAQPLHGAVKAAATSVLLSALERAGSGRIAAIHARQQR